MWIVAGVAVAALTVLVSGRIALVDYSAAPPEPSAGPTEVSAGGVLAPGNSPALDVDVMKLKRVIDANQQHADLERAGIPMRKGNAKPNLGALVEPVSATFAAALGLRTPRGAMISEVAKDGLADKAGLWRGDVIVRFNGEIVTDVLDLDRRVANTVKGETVKLDIWRILGPSVDTFTIAVTLPSAGQAEPIFRSVEKRALPVKEAREIMKQYDETARAAIKKMNQ